MTDRREGAREGRGGKESLALFGGNASNNASDSVLGSQHIFFVHLCCRDRVMPASEHVGGRSPNGKVGTPTRS